MDFVHIDVGSTLMNMIDEDFFLDFWEFNHAHEFLKENTMLVISKEARKICKK